MPLLPKILFTGFSPNITRRDVAIACRYLFLPWNWPRVYEGNAPKEVEQQLQTYFSTSHSFVIDSGRSALLLSLKVFGVGPGDEVLIQAYTCVVVINAIQWTGATPVYVDIDEDFCMDPEDAKKKITSRTKVLIIQHTFGQAAEVETLMKMAVGHGVRVIEDCAHSFGARYDNQLLGKFGDIAMFSFGSDKVVSSARGGALITHDPALAASIAEEIRKLPRMTLAHITRHLLHYPFFYIGRALYGIHIGRWLLGAAKKLGMINLVIEPGEKKGLKPMWQPARFPQALAHIAWLQIAEVDQMNEHRKRIAAIYAKKLSTCDTVVLPPEDEECIYLRYTIRVQEPRLLRAKMKKKGILLGDWYDTVIAPGDIDMNCTGYQSGSCPVAEKLATESVNLPTGRHISERDAYIIIDALISCLTIPLNK